MDYLENLFRDFGGTYMNSEEEYVKLLNDLTGVFTADLFLIKVLSCLEMLPVFKQPSIVYMIVVDVSSHSELLGDVCNLEKDSM